MEGNDAYVLSSKDPMLAGRYDQGGELINRCYRTAVIIINIQ